MGIRRKRERGGKEERGRERDLYKKDRVTDREHIRNMR